MVTALSDDRCRLVLKPTYKQFPGLKKLVREHGGTVIDFDRPAADVKADVLRRAQTEDTAAETPEASGGKPYVVTGNTYPHREALKEEGLRWDGADKVWTTYDSEKWKGVLAALDAEKTGERTARIPAEAAGADEPAADPGEAPAPLEDADLEDVEVPGSKGSGDGNVDAGGSDSLDLVIVSTDGAQKAGTNAGGWAAVIQEGDRVREIAGQARGTTNNRMELTAILKALLDLPDGARVLVRSDSEYAIKVVTGEYEARANTDLIERIREQVDRLKVEWTHVEGHSGDPHNERADDLAEGRARVLSAKIEQDDAPRYVIEGNTYPIRHTAKERGMRWDSADKVWYTEDEDTWRAVVQAIGAEITDDRTAEAP